MLICCRYQGCKIKGKLILKPFLINGVHLLLQMDEEGCQVTRLSVYGYGGKEKDVEKDFPAGAHVTIYDPYYKVYNDDFDGFRVDNFNDIGK